MLAGVTCPSDKGSASVRTFHRSRLRFSSDPSLKHRWVKTTNDFARDVPENMSTSSDADYHALSLLARFAVALRAVEDFCAAKSLAGPRFTAFFDHLWELPTLDSFPEWESYHDDLLAFGLGDSLPVDVAPLLRSASVPEDVFRPLIEHTVEVIYDSAYGASDDAGSLRELSEVLRICQAADVPVPAAQLFAGSLFADGHGWGMRLSPQQRDHWRFAAYDTPAV